MSRLETRGRRFWVTGASSGIGRALCLELARRGGRVLAAGRDEVRLTAVAQEAADFEGEVLTIAYDITSREANAAAADEAERRFGGVDTVVLNAGTCEYHDIENFDGALFERLMNINYTGCIWGIEAALPLLRKSQAPHLVGMSSSVAWRGLPRGAAYSATKAAQLNLFEGLRFDLMKLEIPVSVICPGFVETPLTDLNDFAMPGRVSAEAAGRRIADGLERREHQIAFPRRFVWPLRFVGLLPSRIYTWLMARGTAAR